MHRQVVIRKAVPEEIEWINTQYDEAHFKHSVYDNEYIAIAELDGEKIGLGRLQHIEDGVAELGGIFVREKYRGLGAAHKIVGHLIENSGRYNKIYCIPFSHLELFYRQFGFEPEKNLAKVPGPVLTKHSWCKTTYDSQTLLLVMKRA